MKKAVNVFNKQYCTKHPVHTSQLSSAINIFLPAWRCSPTCTEHHIHIVLIEVTYPASLSTGHIKKSQNAQSRAKPVSRQFMPPAVKGCNIEYLDVNAKHFCTLCISDLRFDDDVHIDRVTFHDNLSVRLNRDQDANPQARDSAPNRRWLFLELRSQK